LEGCDWKELLELIERIRKRVTREFGPSVETISCYEASYDGFWQHRLLEGHGVRNHVIDPASLQVDRRVRRAKTDRIDAARLPRSLTAHARGQPKVWSVVRVPSVAEEDDRLHRERDRLINERGQHVNRIKGLCAVRGIYDYEPMHSPCAPGSRDRAVSARFEIPAPGCIGRKRRSWALTRAPVPERIET
jgi:transposase